MVNRRVRHLNPASAGATIVLDPRFISGTDGSAISLCPDISPNGYNATQSSSGLKPILKTGANGQGGNNVMLFNGTSNVLESASLTLNTYSVLCVANQSNAASFRAIVGRGNTTVSKRDMFVYYGNGSNQASLQRSDSSSFPTALNSNANAGWNITASTYDGSTLRIYVAGGTPFTASASLSSQGNDFISLGAVHEDIYKYYFDSSMGAVVIFNGLVLSSSLQKRVQQSLGYTWKIPTS